jgi:small-conductance mechanosensitive channel
MTAGGNEDKVAESKKLLGAGVIGLAIVLAAWSVATFVINSIYNATSNTGM